MKFFVDTNVIVDLFQNRQPFNEVAAEIFSHAESDKIKLYTSSHSIATVHYLNKKFTTEEKLRIAIDNLIDFIEIIPVNESILRKSLKSNHKDYEDAIQIFCAHTVENLDGIITRNIKDFSTAEIPVVTPDEVLKLL